MFFLIQFPDIVSSATSVHLETIRRRAGAGREWYDVTVTVTQTLQTTKSRY